MVALYRAGRQPEALEAFRVGRAALVEAFGIEPTPALKELESRVLLQDPALDAPEPSAARAAHGRSTAPSCSPPPRARTWTGSSPSGAAWPPSAGTSCC